ncbi:MAG: TRAP transporter small permease [Deltaproteobacteria bacterium]|nr:TRAP transporter small permease [Deltaproteobacteria bacterium]
MRKITKGLQTIEECTIGALLLFLAVVTFCETLLRYTVSLTFMWFNEFANYTLIFMTFLGASLGVKYGTHFSMEAFTESLSGRWGHLLKTSAYLFSSLICTIFVVYGTHHVIQIKNFGVKSSALQIPMYIPYLCIPFFSATMGLRFFILSLSHLRFFLKREEYKKITNIN